MESLNMLLVFTKPFLDACRTKDSCQFRVLERFLLYKSPMLRVVAIAG
jgi:hypothetical protein